MSHGGLSVSAGIVLVGVGLFVLAYPAALLDSTFGPARAVAASRPARVTTRRWAQLWGLLVAAVGVGLAALGFVSMF